MGHYAGEMDHESNEEKRLRTRYYKVRKTLEGLPTGMFSVGELRNAFDLLSDDKTPGAHGFRHKHFVQERISEMQALMRTVKKRK